MENIYQSRHFTVLNNPFLMAKHISILYKGSSWVWQQEGLC